MIRALPLWAACIVLGIVLPPSAAALLPRLHSAADVCVNAPPAANFTNNAYEGTWFEIAKYQTAGGAFFERNCVCTEVEVSAFAAPSFDYSAHFSCRDKTPNGKYLNATGRLYDEAPPGKWMQKLMAFVPPVSYTIVAMGSWQGEEYSVEYDCGGSNYCVHLSARKPTMSSELLQQLLGLVEDMKLNVHNLPLRITNQTGCW